MVSGISYHDTVVVCRGGNCAKEGEEPGTTLLGRIIKFYLSESTRRLQFLSVLACYVSVNCLNGVSVILGGLEKRSEVSSLGQPIG